MFSLKEEEEERKKKLFFFDFKHFEWRYPSFSLSLSLLIPLSYSLRYSFNLNLTNSLTHLKYQLKKRKEKIITPWAKLEICVSHCKSVFVWPNHFANQRYKHSTAQSCNAATMQLLLSGIKERERESERKRERELTTTAGENN